MKKTKRSKDSQVVLEQTKKKFSKKTIWGIVLALIMLLSGVGFYFGSSSSGATFRYNGFKFEQDTQLGRVILHAKNKDVLFYDTPQNVVQFKADNQLLVTLKNSLQFYLTFDPNGDQLQTMDLVRFDLSKTLNDDFSVVVGNGILDNDTNQTAYLTYPIVTCANATRYVPVVVLGIGNETALAQNTTNCFVVSAAQSSDLLRMRDRILYSFYGVLP